LSSIAARPDAGVLARARALHAPPGELLFGTALALLLALCGLRAGGGLALGPTTKVEIVLDLIAGALGGVAALAASARRWWGGVTLGCFAVLLAVTSLSITWALQPSDAWLEANRTAGYVALFASAIVLARLAGAWWNAVLGAVCAATLAISVWAILTKVFPGALAADEIYARLRQPYGYWNAVGLTATLGVPPTLWLGARRTGHAAVNALAYPIMGVLLLTVLLAYSRGSLLAVAVGCAFWFAVVPLRLRAVVVLAVGAFGALLVSAWAFSQDTLTKDNVSITQRATSGHELGIAVLAMVLLLLAIGLLVGFAIARRAPSHGTRRRAGAVILGGLALVPVLAVVALALSSKGIGGSLSSGWKSLTDPNSTTRVYNDPSRLTSVGSVRARYWDESFKVWRAHKLTGVGAGGYRTARLRFRTDQLAVAHAHGYAVQTAADLGIAGMLASIALLLAWLVAAARTLGWRVPGLVPRAADGRFGPEHVGMATLATIVLVFGVHSFIDWTWFVPGTAVIGLLAAGWVAGRGPLTEPAGEPRDVPDQVRAGWREPIRITAASIVVLLGVLAAWTAWQPLRAAHASNDALDLAVQGPGKLAAAREKAEQARDRNPLSIDPLVDMGFIETQAKNLPAARRAFTDAVRLQPSNPATWEYLARFELAQGNNPRLALRLLGPALYLDPKSPTGAQDYLDALRAVTAQAEAKAKADAARKAAEAKSKSKKKR
jgi:hypothetical protein